MSRHPHADLMIAYANDTSLMIEVSDRGEWCVSSRPLWLPHLQYRIKPAPKKVYVFMYKSKASHGWLSVSSPTYESMVELRLTSLNDGSEVTDIKEVEFE